MAAGQQRFKRTHGRTGLGPGTNWRNSPRGRMNRAEFDMFGRLPLYCLMTKFLVAVSRAENWSSVARAGNRTGGIPHGR